KVFDGRDDEEAKRYNVQIKKYVAELCEDEKSCFIDCYAGRAWFEDFKRLAYTLIEELQTTTTSKADIQTAFIVIATSHEPHKDDLYNGFNAASCCLGLRLVAETKYALDIIRQEYRTRIVGRITF